MTRIEAADIPDLWRRFEQVRDRAIKRGDTWPGYIWLPLDNIARDLLIASEAAMTARNAPLPLAVQNLPMVPANAYALATWRLGKGIYRFDDELRSALLTTPILGDIPTAVLRRLPEWCVYVETPGYGTTRPIHGFFAFLTRTLEEEALYILPDMMDIETSRVIPVVRISLEQRTIEDAIRHNMTQSAEVYHSNRKAGGAVDPKLSALYNDAAAVEAMVQISIAEIGPLLSLTLYLCAEDREFDRPVPPQPEAHTKHSKRWLAAKTTRLVGVGLRLGSRLREAASQRGVSETGSGTVIPHLRRAHWHTYLYGHDRSDRRLRWLHPILVNEHARSDDDPAVLHLAVVPLPESSA